MPRGLVRVPHGWWTPETVGDHDGLSGAWRFADAQLSDDQDPALIDLEQGVPHLKGLPGRVTKLSADEVSELEAIYGPSGELPPGPRSKIAPRPEISPTDFMYDPAIGDGVEFQAVELSIYGKGTVSSRAYRSPSTCETWMAKRVTRGAGSASPRPANEPSRSPAGRNHCHCRT